MMNAAVTPNRRWVWTAAIVGSLGLGLLGAGTALAQTTGLDVSAMLQACQHAMAGLGINVSMPQMQAMMGNCLGQMGHMGMRMGR